MRFRPINNEKAVKLIEIENTLLVEVPRKSSKPEIKKEFEELFDIKVDKVRTLIRGNKKRCYIKLNEESPALDVATELGMM